MSGLLCLIHGLRRRPASNYLNTDTSQGLPLRRVSLAGTQTGFQCTLASKNITESVPGPPALSGFPAEDENMFYRFLGSVTPLRVQGHSINWASLMLSVLHVVLSWM